MKLHQPLTILAASSLLGQAQAGWLRGRPFHSWQDYCTSNGAHANTGHVCFESSDPNIVHKIASDSGFQGYYSGQDRRSKYLLAFEVVTNSD